METGPRDLNPMACIPFTELQAVLEYGPAAVAAGHLFRGPKVPLCHGYTAMAPVQNCCGQYTILCHFVTENLLTVQLRFRHRSVWGQLDYLSVDNFP